MKRYRTKCSCGAMQDFKDEMAICPSCNEQLFSQTQGRLIIYRKAMFMACEKKFKVYVNGELLGEIGCKQKITYCLPYGAYTIHFECGDCIKCKDVTIELSEEKTEVCLMTRVKMLFWKNVIIMEQCEKEDLAKMDMQ